MYGKGLILIIVFMSIVMCAMAQGPIISADLAQDFQIKVGDAGQWVTKTADSIQFLNEPVTATHKYFTLLGPNTFECDLTGIYDNTLPKAKFVITFLSSDLANSKWFHTIYVRFRLRATLSGEEQVSNWCEENFVVVFHPIIFRIKHI